MSFSDWNEMVLEDVIQFNPRESIKKGTVAKKIGMDKLTPFRRKISGYEIVEFKSGTKFRNGDTLLARITPCLENGKTAQVSILNDDEVAFGSTEFIVMREKMGETLNDYIYYLSISDEFRNIAIKSMTGTSGRQRAQKDVLEKIKMLIPPIEEQKAIAHILLTLDKKIETNNQINKTLENMAQAIFKQWFVDFEFPNEDGVTYKSSGGQMVENELGMIPVGWEIKTLNDISKEIITGKTPSKKNPDNFGEEVPFVKIPDMHGNPFIVETSEYLSESGANNKKVIPKNGLMISCIATPGLVSIASENCQTNQQINSMILEDEYMLYYTYFKLNDLADYIRTLGSTGSATLNLNKGEFSKIKIIVPEKALVNKFYYAVNEMFESILLNMKMNISLINMRDTLLPKLMSGEIRVPLEDN
ncbi:MAG: restriction endonuclease subunit S [Tissierellales bacterium]|jgi:type I restriction enzyme S subunit|nr:restriction endonuclease subunit S [Tissierellales bacterium]